ncbi:MAG: nicotinamide mononucleotide transporter [Crocinitomicaceae bacterium]|nr:nicotinamide mononucleotide transporter [Crocinitomicaceae bacterium]
MFNISNKKLNNFKILLLILFLYSLIILKNLTFYLEICAVFTGIISVWFAKKENILLYPIGTVSVLIWIYLCWIAEIYSQAVINLFFFVMNIYGWYNWSRKDNSEKNKVQIKFSSLKENLFYIIVAGLLTWLIYSALSNVEILNFNWKFVLIESFITTLNFIAMWLMAWKRVENWVLWIIGDIFCIPLFVFKEYYLSVAQFSIFIIIAFMGYFEWKKKALKN